jgi:hypothetical protein
MRGSSVCVVDAALDFSTWTDRREGIRHALCLDANDEATLVLGTTTMATCPGTPVVE